MFGKGFFALRFVSLTAAVLVCSASVSAARAPSGNHGGSGGYHGSYSAAFHAGGGYRGGYTGYRGGYGGYYGRYTGYRGGYGGYYRVRRGLLRLQPQASVSASGCTLPLTPTITRQPTFTARRRSSSPRRARPPPDTADVPPPVPPPALDDGRARVEVLVPADAHGLVQRQTDDDGRRAAGIRVAGPDAGSRLSVRSPRPLDGRRPRGGPDAHRRGPCQRPRRRRFHSA